MRDTIEGMELFYLAPALMGVGLSHSGKATQVSLTRAIPPPPVWYCPWASCGWAQHMEDPRTQPSSAYSGQGTLHPAGNSIPTSVGQLAHPRQAPPLNFTWLQVGKQRPSILPECGGSSRLSPAWCGPWLSKSSPLLLKALGQVITWEKFKDLSEKNPFWTSTKLRPQIPLLLH